MRRTRENLIERLEALVSTGSPGLYRVLTFWAIQHVYSLDELGHTASSMAIAQMAGFFTAIGWATLILVRLPAAVNRQDSIDIFYALASMAGLTTMAATVSSAACFVLGIGNFDVSAFVPLLWGWTVYQVARHYFVSQKRYRTTVAFDFALIGMSIVLIWFGKLYGLPSSECLAIALIATGAIMFGTIGLPSRRFKLPSFEMKGLQFGLTNFLSGGIAMVFIPAAKLMCGASFAGLLSLFSSVTAVGVLLPRAISMTLLPELSKKKSSGMPLDDVLGRMRRIIRWSNGIIFLLNVLVVIGLTTWQVVDHSERVVIIFAGVLLAIQCAVGVMGTVSSSVMMLFERSREAAWINIKTSALFLALYFFAVFWGGNNGFSFMLISAISVAAVRNIMTANDARLVTFLYKTIGQRGAK